MNNALSRNELLKVEFNINEALLDAEAFISETPEQRQILDLPVHFNNVQQILLEFQQLKSRMPDDRARHYSFRIRHILDNLESLQFFLENLEVGAPAPPGRVYENIPGGGRRLVLDLDLLQELSDLKMTDKEIASFLGCCRRTILRKRKEHGIQKRDWNPLSDGELVEYIVCALKHGSGMEGEKGIEAALNVMGIKVPRQRMREAMARIPRAELVPRQAITRRIYSVPWINSLWHIDGHHKLIRWKIVIHGGIDGYSRMITFLEASDNNRAETMLAAFKKGLKYGFPSRVRADHGKENWLVKDLMEEVRGLHRGSFIMGPSTRNQRIERLWVDLQKWCTGKFKRLFSHLEQTLLLDLDNPLEMWVLHFCYLPMINQFLEFFVLRWNIHGLRTKQNNSPSLIWTRNQLEAAKLGIHVVENPLADTGPLDPDLLHATVTFADYGVDHDYAARAVHQPSEEDPYVEVQPVTEGAASQLVDYLGQEALQQELSEVAGPYWPVPDDFGVDRYKKVRDRLALRVRERFPDLLA